MKRSQAPSIVQSKKPKIATPTNSDSDSEEDSEEDKKRVQKKVYIDITKKQNLKKKKKQDSDEEDEIEMEIEKSDDEKKSDQEEVEIERDEDGNIIDVKKKPKEEREPEDSDRYFSVVYHHKKGGTTITDDGLLVVTKDNYVTLRNMDYKDIGHCTSKIDITVNMNIKMGNKNIEIQEPIEEDSFMSGSFFLKRKKKEQQGKLKESTAKLPSWLKVQGPALRLSKPTKTTKSGSLGFQTPYKGTHLKQSKPDLPLFNPNAPNALVLYNPLSKFDKNNKACYAVVVDPFIANKLRPHQREGVQFLFECMTSMRNYHGCGAILADEMGLGKTIQTVTLTYTLLRQGRYGEPTVKKAIIVAPSSLVKNWCNEFVKWLGDRVSVLGIGGPTKKGKDIISDFALSREMGGADVLCISYEQFLKYAKELYKISAVDLLVCDEGHRLKNNQIKTSQTLNALNTKRRIILSGTPIQNDLEEFYAMVDFVNPGILDKPNVFKNLYQTPINAGRDPNATSDEKRIGKSRSEELSRITSQFILRRTASINSSYLPDKYEMVVFVRLTELQEQVYQAILKSNSNVDVGDNETGFSRSALACITALKKLCNHPELIYRIWKEDETSGVQLEEAVKLFPPNFGKSKTVDASISGKLFLVDNLLNALKKTSDRIVIVSNYTQTLDILVRLCKERGYGYFRLDGDTVVAKRQTLVDEFNQSRSEFVFLLSSKAGGVGLNLVGANRLILFDPDWNPAADLQAMARVWRDGQEKRVFIYRLLSTGTIEEKIYQRQVTKQGLSTSVVDEKTTVNSLFTTKDLRDLFKLNNTTQCQTHDLLGCLCAVKEKVSRRALFTKKKTTMEELNSWNHHDDISTVEDPLLIKAAEKSGSIVSFAFSNLVKGEKIIS